MQALARYGWVALVLMSPLVASAACPDEATVAAYIADFKAARPSKGFSSDLTIADAECARAKVVKGLPEVLGRVIGYKAGFTNPASHARFGVKGPAWGVMFERMMVDSGAKISAKFGARPLSEADFIAVAKDAGLADAKTPLEALRHISAVVPFIELPDLMFEGQFTGAQLIAANVGFRAGVLGPRIAVEQTQAFLDSLANMTVVMTEDKSGKEISRVKGSALMDNPINAALWLAQTLKKEGIALKPGDLLSLGGYAIVPSQPGTTITVKYLGLPGDPSVTVHLE